MTTAEHLDTIDRLRAKEFPPEPVRTGGNSSGPGFHLVQLARTQDFWDDDGTGRIEAADQIGAEYGALAQAVTDRWGEPQVVGLGMLRERGFGGEEIPQPWGEIGDCTDHVHLWRVGEHWLVAYVAQWSEEDPYQLMAGVTVTDPL
ncbi:hypothetical protein [Streptomyces virginiae]|uniref:hypothetical protein n=1 Tax=Streptomyces virginiae TaxID=1961 RepID=UPI002251DB47|nr:hypothetical protein [Streptomyces virginiae]MCX4720971.1 hypothetical protein [Streptomyces virginiae]MCX5275483.1 hypothetical protein [Streptomyces virginiae]